MMRTTLDIAPDVLSAVKELARAQDKTAGEVISDLARQALQTPAASSGKFVDGFEVLPAAGRVVTSELVQKILDEGDV